MRTFIFPLAFAGSFAGFAQIPNGGFESWYNSGSFMEPTSWWTPNMVTHSLYGVLAAEQGTPAPEGNTFMKVSSRFVGNIVENGRITCGNEFTGYPGVPFSQRPQSFNGMVQYHPQGNDAGQVHMALMKWDPVLMGSTVVANAVLQFPSAISSWQPFSVDFLYYSTEIPDTARITVVASNSTPVDGTSIWVDDLHVQGGVGISEYDVIAGLTLFPTPASEFIHLVASEPIASVAIRDLSGRLVHEELVMGERVSIDVTRLGTGFYAATFTTSDGRSGTRRFVRE